MKQAKLLNKTRPYDKDADTAHQDTQHWSDQKQESGESKIE
jgi:hypothetical protein